MSNRYRGMSDSELLRLWEELRQRIMAAKVAQDAHQAAGDNVPPPISQEDWDAAFSMRKELDRRRGIKNPVVDVDFEDMVKD